MFNSMMLIMLTYFTVSPANDSANNATNDPWPNTVLITNDNGINDLKIIELAKAFSKVSKTFVVASLEDQSGTSTHAIFIRQGSIRVVRREIGKGIVAYGVEGYPADCVMFGVGLMQNDPPDLVISGINGGPNLGAAWFGSGTIGAARTAALLGIPAIAVSGLDDSDKDAVARATKWVVNLARSKWVRDMKPGEYLTISIPVGPPDRIKGVKVAKRAPIPARATTMWRSEKNDQSGFETWKVTIDPEKMLVPEGCDIAAYAQGYIVVVPMNINEHDDSAQKRLSERIKELPAW